MRFTLYIDTDRGGPTKWKDLLDYLRDEADRLEDHLGLMGQLDDDVRVMSGFAVRSWDGYNTIGKVSVKLMPHEREKK